MFEWVKGNEGNTQSIERKQTGKREFITTQAVDTEPKIDAIVHPRLQALTQGDANSLRNRKRSNEIAYGASQAWTHIAWFGAVVALAAPLLIQFAGLTFLAGSIMASAGLLAILLGIVLSGKYSRKRFKEQDDFNHELFDHVV